MRPERIVVESVPIGDVLPSIFAYMVDVAPSVGEMNVARRALVNKGSVFVYPLCLEGILTRLTELDGSPREIKGHLKINHSYDHL